MPKKEEKKSKREEVKAKIDKAIEKKPVATPQVEPQFDPADKDTPTVWTPFAKKIYADIKLYKDKLADGQPTRAVATKFRTDIDTKLEAGKEKDSLIKYYNKEFRLPGVSTLPWNYFAESVIDPKADEKNEQSLVEGIENLVYDAISMGRSQNTNALQEAVARKYANKILDFFKNVNKKESTI